MKPRIGKKGRRVSGHMILDVAWDSEIPCGIGIINQVRAHTLRSTAFVRECEGYGLLGQLARSCLIAPL